MTDITKTSYDNTKVSGTGEVTARSQIPSDINLPTKLAVTSLLRSVDSNKTNISDGIKKYSEAERIQQLSKDIDNKLSNFKPQVLTGNAIQRKGLSKQTEKTTSDSSTARKAALSGADPITQALADQAKALLALSSEKQKLLQQTDALKNQIDALNEKLMAATTAGEAEALQDIENSIALIEKTYNTTKTSLDAINKAYNDRSIALEKLRTTRERTFKKLSDNLDSIEKRLLSIPEIPLRIKFPAFPKLPSLAPTRSTFKQQLSNLKTSMVSAAKTAAKQSLDQSAKESKERLNTGKNMDSFQTAASNARKQITELRKQAQAAQAAKTAALTTFTDALKAQINVLQKQAAVMEANINDNIDTQALRIDSNIRSIRSNMDISKQFRDTNLNKIGENAVQSIVSGSKLP